MPFKHVFILTGAGISAESGLPTYRDENGLWLDGDSNRIISADGLESNFGDVNGFFNKLRRVMLGAKPNLAHLAISQAQKNPSSVVRLITQNIDNLHIQAGSVDTIAMHGQINKARCFSCGFNFKCGADIDENMSCFQCEAQMTLRPDVVLFGENPMQMREIEKSLDACDLFISIGTSGEVYPAADFVRQVKTRPDTTAIQINIKATKLDSYFDNNIIGNASIEVPKLLQDIGLIQN